MSKDKISILNFIAALCFYTEAIIYFIDNDTSRGVIFSCLGSTNLCIGAVNKRKSESDKKGKNK